MQSIEINITPVAKCRMTRSDKWKKKNAKNPKNEIRPCVEKYWAFKDELLKKAGNFVLGDAFSVTFILPFPKSYSKKKTRELLGKPHQVKPDLDNLEKSICDSFCKNDSNIYKIHGEKMWGNEGKIIINNFED